MPCYLTQQLHVDLSKVPAQFVLASLKGLENVTIVFARDAEALVSLGAGESIRYRNGKLDITARSTERTKEIENAVKRGISMAVLGAAEKRFRWQLQPDKEKPREFEVVKRGF